MNIIKLIKNILRNLKFTMSNIPKKAITISYPEKEKKSTR